MGNATLPALPGPKTPGWEFTDLEGFDYEAFPAGEPGASADPVVLEAPDGTVALGDLTEEGGPLVMSLEQARERFPDLVGRHLGTVVAGEDPFVARNEAAWRHGAFVYVPRGASLQAPVEIEAVHPGDGSALAWRNLIVLDEGAEAEVWEQFLSSSADGEGVLNAVTELVVGPGANLRYVNAQGLSERSWVFGTQRAEVHRDGALDWVSIGFGSARGKVRMETKLAGTGSSARVTGAYAGHERQHLDFDTLQEHAAENTTSDLAFRGILQDRATSVWRGMIRVDPGAQQTDAFQENRNLLLSTDAHADAIPGLEIEANDVRCTHAAAVAQVDREQLFYLMSRGLPREDATHLVIEGFMHELVQRLREGPIRDSVADALDQRLELLLD